MTGRIKNFASKVALNFIKLRPIYKQLPVIVGVPVIIKDSKRRVLLGKRKKNMYTYAGYWGLPGGLVAYGETLAEAAKREVEEEIGIKIKVTKMSKKIYEAFPDRHSLIHSIGIPFYGKIMKGVPEPKEETDEVGWFTPKEIKKMRLAYNHKRVLKKEGILK